LRAVKILRKVRMDDKEKAAMENEINILKTLDHPNILKIHESYECEKRYYIVTDICKGGELFDEITKNKFFTENNAAQVMHALLRCLKYLHQEGIVHRDLKPENLLLEEHKNYEQVKLIDFGTAKKFSQKDLPITQMVGTPYYIAPEVIKKSYDEKCDLWSAGVIMYIILSGQPPFGGRNEK
jgi:calcium-dependent protein kinase